MQCDEKNNTVLEMFITVAILTLRVSDFFNK